MRPAKRGAPLRLGPRHTGLTRPPSVSLPEPAQGRLPSAEPETGVLIHELLSAETPREVRGADGEGFMGCENNFF